ncbi:Beta-1,4-galactosyltransferase 1 [Takifugu flavidus]|uniref:Beta-1,4-galactosyltransferase n=1 Tax=Takifugu flavidus TaxID=433684 RepID=A0A5C6MNC5_9TELE|nr:Beta-1,4-galactosyltransferase 1 [Takifugu flavidus]
MQDCPALFPCRITRYLPCLSSFCLPCLFPGQPTSVLPLTTTSASASLVPVGSPGLDFSARPRLRCCSSHSPSLQPIDFVRAHKNGLFPVFPGLPEYLFARGLIKVAIIIPYRNRHEHLKHLLFYLHPMLVRQQLDYGIYVINQDGEGVFNRAKLMNVGFAEALKDYDYECFVFSDVDLVPMDDRNLYRCFESPRHLSVAIDKFNFQLPYNTYFGGVSAMSKQQFLTVNGFPNAYWGWGGEDDDMYKRIIFHGMSISRPDHITGKYKMIKHDRDDHNADNPERLDKLSHTRETMDKDGINTLNYTVKDIVKDRMYTFINVDIKAP